MKKAILKITFAVMLGLGLSSCLGDTESTSSGTGIAYISADAKTGAKYAWMPSLQGWYPIKSAVIDNELSVGDFVRATYKINTDNVNSQGLYVAKEFTVLESYPARDQSKIKLADVEAETNVDLAFNTVFTNNMMFASSADFNDSWFVPFSTQLVKDQSAKIQFYYDARPESQKNANGSNLEANTVIVDLRLTKTQAPAGDDLKPASVEQVTVGNFGLLRGALFASATEDQSVIIIFRYYSTETKDGVVSLKVNYVKSGVLNHTEAQS